MQFIFLLLLFVSHCPFVFSSSKKNLSSQPQSLQPVSSKKISLSNFTTDDTKRFHDHLVDELERSEKYLVYARNMHESSHRAACKIAIAEGLLHELKVVDGNADLYGYEDIAKPLQTMFVSCCSCLPRHCIEFPSDMYLSLVRRVINNHLQVLSKTVSAQERSQR
jgi:hypothetical protein